MDTEDGAVALDSSADICAQLMQRYSASSAPQHRHLIATAAAMKGILLDDSLPLSPLSYFAATITSLSQPHQHDPSSASALATLLSIVLPIIPEGSISQDKSEEAVRILVRLLQDEKSDMAVSTSSARCVVKCLGVLLGFCDLREWKSVKLAFETLLKWSTDKRPKVRKCAVSYVENALKCFDSGNSKKKACKLILSLLETNMPLVDKLVALKDVDGSNSKKLFEVDYPDIVHILNITRVALPYFSDKTKMEVVLKLSKILHVQSPALTRAVLSSIETFFDSVEIEAVTEVVEEIIPTLSSYVSSNGYPTESVVSAVNLLKVALDKIHSRDVNKWSKLLPLGFNAIAGLLRRESDIAVPSSNVLTNLIDHQFDGINSHPAADGVANESGSNAITAVCASFMELLDACNGIPNEHILAVISVLFLKIGTNSFFYMKSIVLKLVEIFVDSNGDELETCNMQTCLGSAVVSMGAEKFLSLVPISFEMEKLTCSNIWLLPILKKYAFGMSLGYFMDHILPIAKSLERASRKVKKSVIRQDLQAYAHDIWGLLPAFCRHPNDISQNFQSFVKLLLVQLEKDTFMHEDICVALQELVKQNKCFPEPSDVSEHLKHSLDSLEDYLFAKRSLCCYSPKVARKNMKALSLYSHKLLQALIAIFIDSSPEKRSTLKKAISCLSSITVSSTTKKIFISAVEKFPLGKGLTDCGECDVSNPLSNDMPCDSSSTTDESQWCLILDLASCVVEGADEGLLSFIFCLTKLALQAGDGATMTEAYNTLHCILLGHPEFCSSKMEELVDLLIGLKSLADVGSLSNRLSALQILLVHSLKKTSDMENKWSFLILNEVIVALKDSKEEARKAAYDVVLKISSGFEGLSAADPDGPYNKLINMILGYLSGPSPHITSAAISALSVLVFKEPELCLIVPDIVLSVASLLHSKAVEVIKAVLGFIKVLVSCMQPKDLQNYVSVIVDGIVPWSSVSRHHFRSKVTVILEIMIRKCGFPTVKLATPERYQAFVKKVSLSRHGKTTNQEGDSIDAKTQVSDVSSNGQNKRPRNANLNERGSTFHEKKRRNNQKQDFHSRAAAATTVEIMDKKNNRFNNKHKRTRMSDAPRKATTTKGGKFGRSPSRHRKSGFNNKSKGKMK